MSDIKKYLVEKRGMNEFFAEDLAIFVVSYGKELFQIVHLASGNTPEPRATYSGTAEGIMGAQCRQ